MGAFGRATRTAPAGAAVSSDHTDHPEPGRPRPNPVSVAESQPSHIRKPDVALRRKAVMSFTSCRLAQGGPSVA